MNHKEEILLLRELAIKVNLGEISFTDYMKILNKLKITNKI